MSSLAKTMHHNMINVRLGSRLTNAVLINTMTAIMTAPYKLICNNPITYLFSVIFARFIPPPQAGSYARKMHVPSRISLHLFHDLF